MSKSYFDNQRAIIQRKLIAADAVGDEARKLILLKQLEVVEASLRVLNSGPLDSPPPFDGLKLTTDLDLGDSPCILGRHLPPAPPSL